MPSLALLLKISTASRLSLAVASALCCLVGHVVGLRSQEQMRRVDARRVVATVQNIEAVRDRSDRPFVGNPVGEKVANGMQAALVKATGDAKLLEGKEQGRAEQKAETVAEAKEIKKADGDVIEVGDTVIVKRDEQ